MKEEELEERGAQQAVNTPQPPEGGVGVPAEDGGEPEEDGGAGGAGLSYKEVSGRLHAELAEVAKSNPEFAGMVEQVLAISDNLYEVTIDNPELAELIQLLASEEFGIEEAIMAVFSMEDLQAAVDATEAGTPFHARVTAKRKAASDMEAQQKQMDANSQHTFDKIVEIAVANGYTEEEGTAVVMDFVKLMETMRDGKVDKKEAEMIIGMLRGEDMAKTAYEQGKNDAGARLASCRLAHLKSAECRLAAHRVARRRSASLRLVLLRLAP
jgi:hypothetical protein